MPRGAKRGDSSGPDSQQQPQLILYQILRSIFRKQLRKPFEKLKEYLEYSSEQSQQLLTHNQHFSYGIEIIQNFRSIGHSEGGRERQGVDGYQSGKYKHEMSNRIEADHYSTDNLAKLVIGIQLAQNVHQTYLKWEAFGKLYQNYRQFKLSKINISNIDVRYNDNTQFADLNPFLDKGREIEAINSYIIDAFQHEDSSNLPTHALQKQSRVNMRKIEQHRSIQNHLSVQKRSVKQSSTAYYQGREMKQNDELQQKILITHRKQVSREEAASTNRHHFQQEGQQHLYLIRDYRIKQQLPTNYIKVPVGAENVKIVQIQTGRRKIQKKRIVRSQMQIQKQICQNCKFCVQMRERKQMMKNIQHMETTTMKYSSSEHYSQQVLSK